MARRGIRQGFATLGAHPQPAIPHVREFNPYIDVNLFSDAGWALESREILPGLGIHFLDSSVLTLEYSAAYERLAETTRIAGAAVPQGEYDFGAFTASYQSNLGRKLGGRISITRGGFFDGDRTSLTGSVTLRPNAHFFFEGTAQRQTASRWGAPASTPTSSAGGFATPTTRAPS